MTADSVLERLRSVADSFAADRRSRQLRTNLDPADFEQLAAAGFLLTGVPTEMGGLWQSPGRSARPTCELLRALAHGDSSVALVSAMHPAVTSFWLSTPTAPAPFDKTWEQQRSWVAQTALAGAWWGTITSEPGSGGDILRTKTIARREDGEYRLSGQKHFGSGSGITSYMITTALPEGEVDPDWFFLDVRGASWDGSGGMKLVAPWDGHGMIATQSHAFELVEFPVTRCAWPGNVRAIQDATGGFIGCLFTAVVVGVVDVAFETARKSLAHRRDELGPYERTEWTRATNDVWLIEQAYEGMLRAMEEHGAAPVTVTRAKTVVAELAESALSRICKVIGGGSFGRQSPFGCWFEDVRALGFLRPPWGLAYDRLADAAWD